MKTSVVPAQITTVEDKMVGNLTFNQILIFIAALISSTTVYLLIPPISKLSPLKLVIIFFLFMIFGFLALRIKGQTGAERLSVFIGYNLRPHLYLFTKNDDQTRDIPKEPKKSSKKGQNQIKNKLKPQVKSNQPPIDPLLIDPALMIRVKLAKKGGVDVSFNKE